MKCSMPGFPVLHYLPEFAQTHVHWVSDAIQPSNPLSPPSPPAFNLAQHQHLFQWVSSLHQVAKILEFQLQISPLNEYSGLISFRIDWFDLAVQGALKSLFQHHSLKVKAVTNLDSELKSRDTTLLTKVCIVKVMVFPILMYRGESWAIDKYLDFRSTRLNLFEKKNATLPLIQMQIFWVPHLANTKAENQFLVWFSSIPLWLWLPLPSVCVCVGGRI